MFQTINGWTKEKMKAQIRAKNNGQPSIRKVANDDGTFYTTCVYRAKDGNACAAGCFIPDDKYSARTMEGWNIRHAAELDHDLRDQLPLTLDGMTHMQVLHDGYDKSDFSGDMREILCKWIDDTVIDADAPGIDVPVTASVNA